MHTNNGNSVTVITSEVENPYGYGRIIRTANGISSIVEEKLRFEAAFFEAVRVLVLRLENTGVGKKLSLKELNDRIEAAFQLPEGVDHVLGRPVRRQDSLQKHPRLDGDIREADVLPAHLDGRGALPKGDAVLVV